MGWHLRCALHARGTAEVVAIDRQVQGDGNRLAQALAGADVVVHAAGVNRSPRPEILQENVTLAKQLTQALDRVESAPVIVFADSTQAGNGSPFGSSKLEAAQHLATWGGSTGAVVADIRLPNLFGENGRPNYNSVVATFCHELATGGIPKIIEDRLIPILHVQDAVDQILDVADKRQGGVIYPEGFPILVSHILEKLTTIHELYRVGEIPDVSDAVDRALFNTYRYFCFPKHYPIHPVLRSDARGDLFECLKAHGGKSLVFCSTSRPGAMRGEHFHLRKIERFLVLRGSALIALRRLFDKDVVRFPVAGNEPAIIDMPTMWTHSITNTGHEELLTLFWADEMLDPAVPDTYREPVERPEVAR